MYKEIGNCNDANIFFDHALKCETKNPFIQVYTQRGLMNYAKGLVGESLKDFTTSINYLYVIIRNTTLPEEEIVNRKNDLIHNLIRTAICYQSLGQFHKAISNYITILFYYIM